MTSDLSARELVFDMLDRFNIIPDGARETEGSQPEKKQKKYEDQE